MLDQPSNKAHGSRLLSSFRISNGPSRYFCSRRFLCLSPPKQPAALLLLMLLFSPVPLTKCTTMGKSSTEAFLFPTS